MKFSITKPALACLSLVSFASQVQGSSVKGPEVYAVIDGQRMDIPWEAFEKEGGVLYGVERWTVGSQEMGFQIRLDALLNPDPSISYSIGVIDFGAPTTFGFFLGTPIVPTGPCTEVAASIEGGLTDFTGDGVSIVPVGARTTLQTSEAGFPLTDLGVPVGDPVTHAATGTGGARTYGLYADGPQPGPAGTFTFLSATLLFTLSGGGDGAALTGFTSIYSAACPVPDAGAGLAGLLGLGALGLMKLRSRKS